IPTDLRPAKGPAGIRLAKTSATPMPSSRLSCVVSKRLISSEPSPSIVTMPNSPPKDQAKSAVFSITRERFVHQRRHLAHIHTDHAQRQRQLPALDRFNQQLTK